MCKLGVWNYISTTSIIGCFSDDMGTLGRFPSNVFFFASDIQDSHTMQCAKESLCLLLCFVQASIELWDKLFKDAAPPIQGVPLKRIPIYYMILRSALYLYQISMAKTEEVGCSRNKKVRRTKMCIFASRILPGNLWENLDMSLVSFMMHATWYQFCQTFNRILGFLWPFLSHKINWLRLNRQVTQNK